MHTSDTYLCTYTRRHTHLKLIVVDAGKSEMLPHFIFISQISIVVDTRREESVCAYRVRSCTVILVNIQESRVSFFHLDYFFISLQALVPGPVLM